MKPLHQLQQHHLGGIRAAWAQLEDPGVAARALRVAWRDLLEQLVDDELVLAERGERLPSRVQVAPLGQRDQLLDLGLDRLGLGLGGLDALMIDHLLAEVSQERLAVRGAPRQLVALALMAHQSSRRFNPRAASVSTTSSIDFLPKFGMALSSPSDFEIRSPTVWIPARLRQLYERTPSSSSSMRMSSIGEPPRPGSTAPPPRPLSTAPPKA